MDTLSDLPQMNLSTKITKAIDSAVESFLRDVSARYDIRHEDLTEAWKQVAGSAKTTKKKRPARPSGYQNFAKTVRPEIRETDPSMSFGDISREVSRRWRALREEERREYNDRAVAPIAASPVASPAVSEAGSVGGGYSPVLLDDEDDEDEPPSRPSTPVARPPPVSFASMPIRALREECKKHNLPLKGNSSELAARLTAHARGR
ncbi:hypothetical protein EBZ80_06665 [bacterium]|nr:hypothetical protein [bacterium]